MLNLTVTNLEAQHRVLDSNCCSGCFLVRPLIKKTAETKREIIKSKIRTAASEAVATFKTDIWYDNNQPSSPRIATANAATASAAAATPGPKWKGDMLDSEEGNLHSKLGDVKGGLDIALTRVPYLEQSIYATGDQPRRRARRSG